MDEILRPIVLGFIGAVVLVLITSPVWILIYLLFGQYLAILTLKVVAVLGAIMGVITGICPDE